MASSEIRVNTIKSRSGLSTITLSDTGNVISGITTIQGNFFVEGGSFNSDIYSVGVSTFTTLNTTTINKVTITAPAAGSTLTIADGKTLTASNTLTFTGTDTSSIAFGGGGTVAYTSNKLSDFSATTSSELASTISDETGSGSLVFSSSPTFTGTIDAADINASGIVTATGGFNLGISSAGSAITSGPVTTLNFIGAGNTFAVNGTTVDISIAGGGGGGGGESYWAPSTSGIHTLTSVGIGTTDPTSTLTVDGNVLITGITTIGGNITLGDNTADDIAVSGEFVSSLIPDTTASYDLGSSTQRWRDVFVSGTVNAATSVLVGSGVTITASGVDVTGIVTATDFNSASDINWKQNIETIDDPLAKVLQIRGVTFDWKHVQESSAGVIAQEVEKVFPQIVKNNNDAKVVNYNGLIGLLVEAIKQQQIQIDELYKRLEE